MEQVELSFNSKLTPQAQRLKDRMLTGPITNVEMRDDLRLLSYTRRLFEVKKNVEPEMTVVKKYIGNGIFQYSLTKLN